MLLYYGIGKSKLILLFIIYVLLDVSRVCLKLCDFVCKTEPIFFIEEGDLICCYVFTEAYSVDVS